MAVAIEGGLFTPVLKDAHQKTLSALSAQMKDLAARAKSKAGPHEYQGGSFAISNLGMFGIENFDAVINPPHGAILAVGAGIRPRSSKGRGRGAQRHVHDAVGGPPGDRRRHGRAAAGGDRRPSGNPMGMLA
ncbi:2-oxo acid dehydrogenase subunit E2 [Paracoccus marcusii]|nr:2-oxo acid dehydrogenase subunit E2 [Paracoccus marcusii]